MRSKNAKRTALRGFIIQGCALAVLTSVGCKTGMSVPGASMLGFKKQPSAEMLAGQGPTTTFPVTPGTSFTPNAIASTTAGTGANSAVPQGAATANGFASTGPTTSPGGSARNPSALTAPPSYVAQGWGGPAAAAPSATSAPSAGLAQGNAYQTPSTASVPSYAAPHAHTAPPSNFAVTNAGLSAQSQPNSFAPSSAGFGQGTGGAFAATPNGFGAGTPNPYAAPASQFAQPQFGQNQFAQPQAFTQPQFGQPSASMGGFAPEGARVAGGFAIPSTSNTMAGATGAQATASGATGVTAPATFRPGSTAGATSYPSTPYSAPSGSMLR